MSGERFEVRLVDEERRVLVRLGAFRKYHDACISADAIRETHTVELVVWDRDEQRALYDSRSFTRSAVGETTAAR